MSADMLNRRSFLAAGALGAAAAAIPAKAAVSPRRTTKGASFKPLKVCVFADIHYQPGVYVNDTPEFLEKILARAERERCDMVIHLGDFVHNVLKAPEKAYIKMYNDFRIPTYHVLGNHDQDDAPHQATLDAYRLKRGYYAFDKGGFRFVVLDPNYYCEEPGKYIHFDHGNYHRRSKNATVNYVPPEQLEWLRSTVVGSPNPCVVLSHQSLERPPNGGNVLNKDDVQAIFAEANAKRPGTVRLVMNGHLHADNLRIMDDIVWWDVNSASNDWNSRTHSKFPPEYHKSHDRACHNVGYKEPLSGILTLSRDGGIRIDGAKSDWLFGVTPKMAGFQEFDSNGRYKRPVIQSVNLKMTYRRG